MSGVSAFDPSTWGEGGTDDGPPVPVEDLYAPPEPLVDRAALEAELADLRELQRSTTAQRDKALATFDAADLALARLLDRIEDVETAIEASHTDEQGEDG